MSAPARDDAVRRSSAGEAMHEEEALGKAYDLHLLGRLWPYVKPYWPQVVLTLLLFFPLFVLELAPALIIKVGLDRVILPELALDGIARTRCCGWRGSWRRPPGVDPLYWLGGLLFAAMILGSAFQFLNMAVMGWTGQSAMRDLRRDVFAHIQRLHMGFFDRYPVGRLVTRATNDVENVAEMFTAGIVALITDLLRMIGVAVLLFLVDARLALMTFLVVPVLAVAAVIFRFKVRAAFRKVRVAHRPHQRLRAGERDRDEGGAALHPGGPELPRVRRAERRPPGRLVPVDPLRRGALLRGGARGGPHRRDHHRPGRRAGGRDALRLHRLDAALLHAAARPLREVLGDAVLDGQQRADLRAARHAAGDRRSRDRVRRPRGRRRRRLRGRLLRLPGRRLGPPGPLLPRRGRGEGRHRRASPGPARPPSSSSSPACTR